MIAKYPVEVLTIPYDPTPLQYGQILPRAKGTGPPDLYLPEDFFKLTSYIQLGQILVFVMPKLKSHLVVNQLLANNKLICLLYIDCNSEKSG
jgi:hypothetical protein